MAAIGLAAAELEREDPDALIGSFAADHVVDDSAAFAASVREAAEVAAQGWLVTIGIEPTVPSSGFGYIRGGARLPGFATALRRDGVRGEAGRRAGARPTSRRGSTAGTPGMFLARATVLLDLLAEHHPELASGLRAIAADPSSLEMRWPGLTRIAIDHAVAEPAAAAGRVAVVPGRFGWEDLGDFASLAALTATGSEGITVLGDESLVVSAQASGLVIPHAGRTVAVVGLDDVVVVDTGDALLVTTYEKAQEVKAVVDELRRSGRTDLT